jgi:uncharacterized membrane protein
MQPFVGREARPIEVPAAATLQLRPMLRLLLIASGVCVALVLVRFACARDLRFRFFFLLFNLLLAWIPVVLAVAVRWTAERGNRPLFWLSGATWLLFFPNTFYLITDLKHANKFGLDGVFWWYDLLMTSGFALAGVCLGSASLYLLHSLVRRRCGRIFGWVFVGGILALASFGIYLGRFPRFNSWDAILRPHALIDGITRLAESPGVTEVATFCAAFFAFSFATYCFFISAAQLHNQPAATSIQPLTADR